MNSKISPSFSAVPSSDAGVEVEALVLLAPVHGATPHARQASTQVAQESFMTGAGKLLKRAIPSSQPKSVPVARVRLTLAELEELAQRADVVGILPNQRVQLIEPLRVKRGGPEPLPRPNGEVTWNLAELDIPGLWDDAQSKGGGVKVGVVDTGVHAEHPALEGRIERAVLVDPLGRTVTTERMFDAGEHGTHVCGVIAGGRMPDGTAIGVAPEARLQVAGALLGEARLSAVLAAIGWAVERGCRILNLSLGFTYYEPLFDTFLRRIEDDFKVVTVVAIGNESHGSSRCPGNVVSALSVGAVGPRPLPQHPPLVAPFSGGATLTFPGTPPLNVVKPDLVAPGVDVVSAVPPRTMPWGTVEYAALEGTSMAAPHVSGVLAILMSALPPSTPPRSIVEALRDTALHPHHPLRPDNRWGWGLVQPREALRLLRTSRRQRSAAASTSKS